MTGLATVEINIVATVCIMLLVLKLLLTQNDLMTSVISSDLLIKLVSFGTSLVPKLFFFFFL